LIALIINIHTLGRVCCRLLSASNELDTPNPHARLSPRALPAAGYDLERPVCFVRSNRQRGGQASLERMFEHGSDAGKAFVQTVLEITQ
jgi:hypothetical protein